MDELIHLEWQLIKLLLGGASVLFSAGLLLYMLMRPFLEDSDE